MNWFIEAFIIVVANDISIIGCCFLPPSWFECINGTDEWSEKMYFDNFMLYFDGRHIGAHFSNP